MPLPEARRDVRAADVLANERTFLAYLRTALAFIAFGFVIARFALFAREITLVAHVSYPRAHASTGFGIATVVGGVVIALYGAVRYATTDAALCRDETAAMPPWAAIVGSAAIAAIGTLVACDLSAFR